MDGDTPLYAAETVEMAQLLLTHGADPTVKNAEGKTVGGLMNCMKKDTRNYIVKRFVTSE